jgi:hypothetical protein
MQWAASSESSIGGDDGCENDERNNEPFHADFRSMPRDKASIRLVREQRFAE